MAVSRIVDQFGRPIELGRLTEEVASPSLTGVRSVWSYGSMADGLTPSRLARVLRGANDGVLHDYLTLAEEMEERDMHYGSVLGTRKRGVSGLEVSVEAASDAAEDVKLADALRERIVATPEFGELIDDLLDALGKGFAVCEIIWDRSGRQWQPLRYEWRDPRFFTPSREDGRTLRLLDEANPSEGVELPPYKFVPHYPRLKSGLPARGGLARLAAVSYMCKSYALSDWMAFAEVYGQPIRVGRYGPSASEADRKILKTAVANIGSDAAAILPESMRIEFIEAAKGASGGDSLFQSLAEWLDRQISKGVLGQTASTEGTPGKLGNEDAQDAVRDDIKRADAKALQNTLNRYLVRPFIDLNFGPREQYPRIEIPVPEAEDLAQLANALEKLVPLGISAPAKWARDKFGIPDGRADDEFLAAPSTAPSAMNHACPACGGHHVALNRQQPDEIDALLEEGLADWERQMTPIAKPIEDALKRAQSYEEFVSMLPGLVNEMDATELVETLARQTFKARGLGDGKA